MKNDPFAPGLLQRLDDPVRSVVVLKASRIGDFLCAEPAFRALRSALPDASFTLITLPMLEELGRLLSHFDDIVLFPGYPGIAEQLFDPRQAARFFNEIQSRSFDLAIQMQGTGLYSNPFALMLGGRYTAGFIRSGDLPGLLSAAFPWPEQGHEVERNLALAAFLGAPPQNASAGRGFGAVELQLKPEDRAGAGRLLAVAKEPIIGLHPAARQLTRRWPMERFLQAAEILQQRFGGTLVWIGETEERPLAKQAADYLRERGVPSLDLVGCTSLPVLAALFERLGVLVTNDTGPAHLAYALGTPTVTIFGAGDPQRYGPPIPGPFRLLAHEVLCRPCSYIECPIGYKCLDLVSVEEVVEAAGEVIHLH